jgi:hypothetical protein
MTRRWILTAASLMLLIPQLLFAQDMTIEFYGTIQSANATAIVINGQIVDIQSAQIYAPLLVGTIVRIRANIEGNNSLVAEQIDAVPAGIIPGVVQIVGVIEEINGSILRINGQRVDILGAQVVGQLNVGELVHVSALHTSPGQWTASFLTGFVIGGPVSTPEAAAPVSTPEIIPPVATPDVAAPVSTPEINAPASTPEVGEDFKISGTLQSFTDADLVVDGQRFFIGGARIDGALAVGAQVQLEIRVVNGQWVLAEVKVVNSSDNSGSDDHGGSSGNDGSGDSGSKGGDDGSGGSGGSNSGGSGGSNSGKGG